MCESPDQSTYTCWVPLIIKQSPGPESKIKKPIKTKNVNFKLKVLLLNWSNPCTLKIITSHELLLYEFSQRLPALTALIIHLLFAVQPYVHTTYTAHTTLPLIHLSVPSPEVGSYCFIQWLFFIFKFNFIHIHVLILMKWPWLQWRKQPCWHTASSWKNLRVMRWEREKICLSKPIKAALNFSARFRISLNRWWKKTWFWVEQGNDADVIIQVQVQS